MESEHKEVVISKSEYYDGLKAWWEFAYSGLEQESISGDKFGLEPSDRLDHSQHS